MGSNLTKISLNKAQTNYQKLRQLFYDRVFTDGGTHEGDDELVKTLNEINTQGVSLMLTPTAKKAGGTLYPILPNTALGDFTYTQNTGNGTIINEQGNIETVPNNTPRITWINGVPEILVEPARTNICTFSEPTQAIETETTSNITFQSYNWDFGLTDSVFFDTNTVNRFVFYKTSPITTGNTYTLFAFVKMTDGSEPQTTLDASPDLWLRVGGNGQGDGNVKKYQFPNTNIWVIAKTAQAGSTPTSTGVLKLSSYSPKTFNCIGFQIYEGNVPVTSSYIKTTGTTEIRNDDIYSVTPPVGTTEIKEYLSNGTINTITTIPATYTPAVGKYKKIVMS